MRPRQGEVLHFSEDPTIERFVPHVAATAQQPEPYVWAVDDENAPSYWFPRHCPRGMAWAVPGLTSDADRDNILGPGGGHRVHAVEYGWLEAIRTATVFAYRLPKTKFQPFPNSAKRSHAWVSEEPVTPLGPPEPVTDLLALHEEAGIQLRVLNNLWPFWDAVTTSTLAFSGIRLANAAPRPATD